MQGAVPAGNCETLCEMELFEQFKQSAQALELLHERKMWNEQKPNCLSEASFPLYAYLTINVTSLSEKNENVKTRSARLPALTLRVTTLHFI